MKFRRLLTSFSLIVVGFNLGFSSHPAIYVPVSAQMNGNRAARLVARERGSQINVRSFPSIDARIQHYGSDGDSVAVLQESKESDRNTWYFVRFPKSQATGWVRGDFVAFSSQSSDPSSPIQTLPDVGNVRFRAVTYERAESINAPALEAEIAKELSGNTANVRYLHNMTDLNNDGRYEVIAYLPSACGTGGCSMMIFRATGNGYALVSRHTLIRNPIVVSDRTTQGWRDLVVYVAGGGIKPSYRILRFDGSTYPSNPSVAPEVPSGAIVSGQAVIANQISPNAGLSIPRR